MLNQSNGLVHVSHRTPYGSPVFPRVRDSHGCQVVSQLCRCSILESLAHSDLVFGPSATRVSKSQLFRYISREGRYGQEPFG